MKLKKEIQLDSVSQLQIRQLDKKVADLAQEIGILTLKQREINLIIEQKEKDFKNTQQSLEGSVYNAAIKCGIDPNDATKGEWLIDLSKKDIIFKRKS